MSRRASWSILVAVPLCCACSIQDDDLHQRLAERHRVEAQRLISTRKFSDARLHLEKALRESEQMKGSDLPLALSLTALGDLAARENHPLDAIPFYRRAAPLYIDALKDSRKGHVPYFFDSMMNNGLSLADSLLACNNPAEAEIEYAQVLEQYRQWWQDKSVRRDLVQGYTDATIRYAGLKLAQHRYSEAENLLSRAQRTVAESLRLSPGLTLRIDEKIQELEHASGVSSGLARSTGSSLTTAPLNSNLPDPSDVIDSEGGRLHSRGDFAAAESKFRTGLRMRIASKSLPIKLAVANEHLADAIYSQGRIKEALPYYLEARSIKETLPQKESGLDYCLHQIGNIYEALGQFDAAVNAFRKSLKIKISLYGRQSSQAKAEESNLKSLEKKHGLTPQAR